jgi:hypothetical protein
MNTILLDPAIHGGVKQDKTILGAEGSPDFMLRRKKRS